MDIRQFDEFILSPTLDYLNMSGLAARRLMVGTALVESGLKYIKQIGGPALGIFQVEPSTYIDNYNNYLDYSHRQDLKDKFKSLQCNIPCGAAQMTGNLYYNTAHARLKYYRDPKPLPNENDSKGMAGYHKKIYNSILGATDINKSVAYFEIAIREIK